MQHLRPRHASTHRLQAKVAGPQTPGLVDQLWTFSGANFSIAGRCGKDVRSSLQVTLVECPGSQAAQDSELGLDAGTLSWPAEPEQPARAAASTFGKPAAGKSQLTLRAVAVGLLVGSLLAFSNTYFGLQTGWVTMGSLQSAILGFGAFRVLQKYHLASGFSVEENVIIQTTSVATATMPLAAGLVGVIPALSIMTPEQNPPYGAVTLSAGQLILWSLALAFIGVFCAVPLRVQTILREKLRFPSGTATANVIRTLHGLQDPMLAEERVASLDRQASRQENGLGQPSPSLGRLSSSQAVAEASGVSAAGNSLAEDDRKAGERAPLLHTHSLRSMAKADSIVSVPSLHSKMRTLGPGAVTGYGLLGPFARSRGWAPGPIGDWKTGATGWVLWVSLAIMLGDSLTSLSLLVVTSIQKELARRRDRLAAAEDTLDPCPSENRIPASWWMAGLAASAVLCTGVLSPMLGLPVYEPLAAVVMALFVAVLAVRALGETDLNPVSGVGKLSQVVFAVIAPGKVVPNLVAGAIAEAGAQQAGDMMQDFKTAHLLGVCPRAQFFAMLIGSFASVFVSVAAYMLYTSAWVVPGPEFPAPTAQIWLDMAELVNGGELPPHSLLPSGIGFAVGMYVSPKWTIPRVIGSLIEQAWLIWWPRNHRSLMVVVASGLVLGEGTASILSAIVKAVTAAH
ncbi:hypothetical protein WJX72_001775 [[Myrmecia] bisecta]|uniref:Oligopeptide transporter n=1 Tax=[Myrmecia] bisecta TaxID=41462 RepID=A0AAW1QPD1_9CHLO